MLQQTRKRRPTSRFEKMVRQTFGFDVGGLVDWIHDGATWPYPSRPEPPDLAVYVLSQQRDVFLDPREGDDPIPRHVVAAIEVLELSTKLASAPIPAAVRKLRDAHLATEDALVPLSALRDQLDRMSSFKGFNAENKKLLEDLGRLTEAFDAIPALAERLEVQYGGPPGRGRKRRDELVELERRLFVRGYTSAEIAEIVDDLGRRVPEDEDEDRELRKNRVGWRRRQRARGYQ